MQVERFLILSRVGKHTGGKKRDQTRCGERIRGDGDPALKGTFGK